jgi:hypothetical protein
MGHGGVINYQSPTTGRIETFKNPENVKSTEIIGMRFSSLLNLTSTSHQEAVVEYLASHKDTNNDFINFLNQSYLKFLKIYSPDKTDLSKVEEFIKTKKSTQILGKKYNNIFISKKRISSKTAQKMYKGISDKDRLYFHSDFTKHNIQGPFVKIYSIIANDTELLYRGETIPIYNIPNNITLTNIINIVTTYIFSDNLSYKGISKFYQTGKKISINVVDLTCNSTTGHPIIGFIE